MLLTVAVLLLLFYYCIGVLSVNILAYADDIVIISPSWRGLQALLDKLSLCARTIDILVVLLFSMIE